MSNLYNDLAVSRVGILRDVDLAAVRALLRAERKKRRMSLDDLAKESGITRSAIHAVEKNPKGQPRLETIVRMIEGMEGLTVSEFFATIERQTKTDTTKKSTATSIVHNGTELVTRAAGASPHGANRLTSSRVGDVAVDALLDVANRIVDAIQQIGGAGSPRETPNVGTPRAGSSANARGDRR